jgi:hypothetical protein
MSKLPNWAAPDGWYSRWWRPDDLVAEFDRESDSFTSEEFYAPRLQPLHEGYVAAHFAHLLPDQPDVQLVCSDPPDFRLQRASGAGELYETTEALPPARRRHAEYKNPNHEGMARYFNSDSNAQLIVTAVQDAITHKAGKNYPQPFQLVVYADFSVLFADALSKATFDNASSFQSVQVLLFQRIVRLA